MMNPNKENILSLVSGLVKISSGSSDKSSADTAVIEADHSAEYRSLIIQAREPWSRCRVHELKLIVQ
jgi:hypothetical protein